MATLDSNIKYDLKFFELLWSFAHPDRDLAHKNFYKELVRAGEIQIETLLENAIANIGGLVKESVNRKDFTDGSDAKKCVARFHSYGRSFGMPIKSIHTKIGKLRIMGYNPHPLKGTFHYFVIPHSAYEHITKTSNIEIPFSVKSGEIITSFSKSVRVEWHKYQVNSFKELSTF